MPNWRWEMELEVHYDPECDAIGLHSGQQRNGSASLVTDVDVIIDLANEDSRQAVALEVLSISAYLPLGKHGYCDGTDTLTFGGEIDTATLVVKNGDLIAYWRRANLPLVSMEPVAVDLKNASKHLKPVIESLSAQPR